MTSWSRWELIVLVVQTPEFHWCIFDGTGRCGRRRSPGVARRVVLADRPRAHSLTADCKDDKAPCSSSRRFNFFFIGTQE